MTTEHSRAYTDIRRADGRKDGTIWTELGHLRIVLNWAVKRGLIDRAPYVELPPKPPPRDVHLTRAEAQRFIAACSLPHVRLFAILALSTGARAGALFDLTWDRVDFERGLISLGNCDRDRRKGRATVPMTQALRTVLLKAREEATTTHVLEYAGKRVGAVRRSFAAAGYRSGLQHVTPHVLRHTAAVWMAEGGVSMPEIAAVLGHRDSRTTERIYAKFSPVGLRPAVSHLEL